MRTGQPSSPLRSFKQAQEDALAELQKLLAMISVQNSRAYGIAVSGVIRRYIERRFAISAPRRSTEEFLLEAKSSARLDERHQKHLGQFLGYCDFLKFARATASVPELQQIHDAAVRFVTDTQDQPITKPAASPASVGRRSLSCDRDRRFVFNRRQLMQTHPSKLPDLLW